MSIRQRETARTKSMEWQDAGERNDAAGKFGAGKCYYGKRVPGEYRNPLSGVSGSPLCFDNFLIVPHAASGTSRG